MEAKNKRNINPTKEWDKYIDPPENKDTLIKKDGNLKQTIETIKDVVAKNNHQVRRLAPMLKDKEMQYKTCENVWNFVYEHIQYSLDEKGHEQIRTPARTWSDRMQGVDCDCMAVFIASLLENLNIPYFFRVTAYNGKETYQHIYVVANTEFGDTIIDTVMDEFDAEKPYSKKIDIHMKLSVLSGVEEYKSTPYKEAEEIQNMTEAQIGCVCNELKKTKKIVNTYPNLFKILYISPNEYSSIVDEAIKSCIEKNVQGLKKAIEKEDKMLEKMESDLAYVNKNELGKKPSNNKKLGSAIRNAINKGKEYVKNTSKGALHVFNKGNPAVVVARGAMLSFLKRKNNPIAARMKYYFLGKDKFIQDGYSPNDFEKIENGYKKLSEGFYAIGGSKKNLDKALRQGAGLSGLDDLNIDEIVYEESVGNIEEEVSDGFGAVAVATMLSAEVAKEVARTVSQEKGGDGEKKEATGIIMKILQPVINIIGNVVGGNKNVPEKPKDGKGKELPQKPNIDKDSKGRELPQKPSRGGEETEKTNENRMQTETTNEENNYMSETNKNLPATTNKSGSKEQKEGLVDKVKDFVKNKPLQAAIIGGAIAYGIYYFVKKQNGKKGSITNNISGLLGFVSTGKKHKKAKKRKKSNMYIS
ncbi:MAG: hypothetical protein QXS90_00355 [Candidatus Diapherotrites archaeon]